LVKKVLIFHWSCANVTALKVPKRGRKRAFGAFLEIPHDAQVRRISWVRGVGRPALAHSGLLVPLPVACRPPSPQQDCQQGRVTSCFGWVIWNLLQVESAPAAWTNLRLSPGRDRKKPLRVSGLRETSIRAGRQFVHKAVAKGKIPAST
jgi:hypothetical protein